MLIYLYLIEPVETIGFGDGNNDVEYLKMVGMGISMKNGSELAKKAVNFSLKLAQNLAINNAKIKLIYILKISF